MRSIKGGKDGDDEGFIALEEIREIKAPMLYVNVDWLDLVEREGEQRAFEIVGKLKDLLG